MPRGSRARRFGKLVGIALFIAIALASMPFVTLYDFVYGCKERRAQRKACAQQQQQTKLIELANDIVNMTTDESLYKKSKAQATR